MLREGRGVVIPRRVLEDVVDLLWEGSNILYTGSGEVKDLAKLTLSVAMNILRLHILLDRRDCAEATVLLSRLRELVETVSSVATRQYMEGNLPRLTARRITEKAESLLKHARSAYAQACEVGEWGIG